MAALVASNNPTILPGSAGAIGVNKRYRPAPAKTFQCRGYGECRMVFSRSEHLARHIRKHTGERPFTCHCSKQFSRLDNLRQHAQTVHADKADQNERMMRELTSLHASMAAANKTGQPRGKRGGVAASAAAVITATHATMSQDHGMHSLEQVKEEDISSVLPMHQRPGTSTGYEGGDNMMYHADGWNTDIDRGNPHPPNNHSFRDPGQSFRVPPASHSSTYHQQQQQSQSFLPFSANSFDFSVSSRDGRPGSSSSRPPTSGGSESLGRTLPPLSAVVSASIPPPSSQSFPLPPQSTQHVLPLPGSLAFSRRPFTANRPTTAPASYYTAKPAYAGGPGLAHQSELPVSVYGRGELAAAAYHSPPFDAEPASPTTGSYDSPFSFHPPAIPESTPPNGALASSPSNPRKRPYPGSDSYYDDGPRREPGSGLSGPGEYEYGTESRPQSRRLSVLELCNDPDVDAGVRSFIPSAGSTSRPTTSSGLVSSASALALNDRTPVSSYQLLPGTAPSAVPAVASAAAASPGTGAPAFGGGRVSPAFRRDVPSPTAPSPAHVLSSYRGAFSASPLSDTSRSPRSQPSSAAFAAVARSAVSLHSNPSSPPSNAATPPTLSRRGGESQHDQVRSSVASAYSAAAVGMKV
ncbi:hypothetical protein BV22DRAFT_1022358 [Leucogyrophana mollusca]|uniref:Uncharacterized protein n=1 Tax=Leucogyrophana mollusca TaxID=85980 RepID=A0ACB8B4Z8_9AGAM|nr:hypothetical protein BV22DRAFT_1022358 [Leucogyrophana mollusca]